MVSLVFGQELARPWFWDPRERRVDAGHPGIRASPPSEGEERDREADQSPAMFGPTTYPSPVPSLIPCELRKNDQNTVTAMDRTIPSVRRYSASYSRSSSPFRGYSALMSRNPGTKKRSTSAPITRAVATTAPRTSSDNARPSGPSIFEDCALDISEEKA